MAPESAVGLVFTALADPTRRAMVETLARRTDVTATSFAAELPITRQAVTKHLAALRDAHLVRSKRVGREVHYRLEPENLAEAAAWIADVGAEWDLRLERLGGMLEGRGEGPR